MNYFRFSLSAALGFVMTATGLSSAEVVPVTLAIPDQTTEFGQLREEFRRDLEIDYPEDNLPNAAREHLGKTLFFDPRLSRSGGQSCASCHNPAFAWGDGLPVGIGDHLEQLERRSPTILNLAWGEPLMWDGRAESLEDQALGPMLSEAEMNLSLEEVIARLQAIEGYAPMFADAFDGDPTITPERVALAIASFERTIVSGMAPFDHWVEGDDDAISPEALRGFELFSGEANCTTCHEGWRLTDDAFYDIGLPDDDPGRGAIVPNIPALENAFKTPGLRNIAQRAPYMHDGQIATLRGVVMHYNEGGIDRPSRSDEIYPLGLSDQDVSDIVAFLETLTSDDPQVTIPVLPH